MKIFIYGLQLVFITLKLAGYINWSWWYVMLPLEISLILAVVFLILLFTTHFLHKKYMREDNNYALSHELREMSEMLKRKN